MNSRIHRGFHRIGVVLAVPALLAAGWFFVREAMRPLPSDGPFMLPSGTLSLEPADFTNVYLALALAALLYAAARAVGWVLAGFLGPRA